MTKSLRICIFNNGRKWLCTQCKTINAKKSNNDKVQKYIGLRSSVYLSKKKKKKKKHKNRYQFFSFYVLFPVDAAYAVFL